MPGQIDFFFLLLPFDAPKCTYATLSLEKEKKKKTMNLIPFSTMQDFEDIEQGYTPPMSESLLPAMGRNVVCL
jgi:alkyl sulfatase BDS1-like metallo-beta-lactamase superfamily hydrolase